MGWVIGIFIYLAIGRISVYLIGVYEDGFWEQVAVMLLWSILWSIFVIIFVICCIYFGWKELYKKVKK